MLYKSPKKDFKIESVLHLAICHKDVRISCLGKAEETQVSSLMKKYNDNNNNNRHKNVNRAGSGCTGCPFYMFYSYD